jgi:uncharacterized protein (TIGR02217 family)
MSFHEVRFPEEIAYGSSGGPEFSTSVTELANGQERRNINWSNARSRYKILNQFKSKTQIELLNNFFRNRNGKAYGFRFKDHTDFSATNQILSVADDSGSVFQLSKTYTNGAYNYVREIKKPVLASVRIYLDGVLQSTGFTVNYENGTVVFDIAPSGGVIVTADFEFDVPVRFNSDFFEIESQEKDVFSVSKLELIEIRV